MKYLLSKGIIKHVGRGYVDARGNKIGYYRTKGAAKQRYIMKRYADMVIRAGIQEGRTTDKSNL